MIFHLFFLFGSLYTTCFHTCPDPMYAYDISVSIIIGMYCKCNWLTDWSTGAIHEAHLKTQVWWIFCLMESVDPFLNPCLHQLTSLMYKTNTNLNHIWGSTRANTVSFTPMSVSMYYNNNTHCHSSNEGEFNYFTHVNVPKQRHNTGT